jgi:hypothetical protein
VGNVKITKRLGGPAKPPEPTGLSESEAQTLLESYSLAELETCGRFIAAFAEHCSPSVRDAYDAVLGQVLAESRKR